MESDLEKIKNAFTGMANQILEGSDEHGNPTLQVNIGSHILTFYFNVSEEGEAKFHDLTVERYALKLDWGEVKIERR